MNSTASPRSASWKWWICGLLLCASSINYMDRQTLANAAVRITSQFQLNQEQYGNLELVFGWAFAVGSMGFGVLVDRVSVRWVYPAVVVLWSAAGIATGWTESYSGLLLCRGLLGLFEGGHWPCAIKTTQRLLASEHRSMGNGILQSGTSIGAILTPLVLRWMLTEDPGSWRLPFQVVGLLGVVWAGVWLVLIGRGDLEKPASLAASGPSAQLQGPGLCSILLSRRFLALLVVVACINTCWQTLRAWLPKFLQQGRGYTESVTLSYSSLFYLASDLGCLGAGALALYLTRRGRTVHAARCAVFAGCAALCALTTAAAYLPRGWPLLVVLLVVGAGALGVFPLFHAFTQELSPEHQGKITGLTGVAAWVISAPAQKFFGRLIDRTGSFDLGLAWVGWAPLMAFFALWLWWGNGKAKPAA